MPTPLPVIADVFRCAIRWAAGSQTAVNVMHLQATVSGMTAADAFEVLQDSVGGGMWQPTSSSFVAGEVDITPLDGVSATQAFPTGGGAQWIGGTSGEWFPQAAGIVKLTTATRGRANRGRLFLPAIAESASADGFLDSTVVANCNAAWVAFIAALEADAPNPWLLVVASYDRAHLGAGAHATTVLTAVLERPLGTQRRRQTRNR
jgi:hypothetical protein